MSKSDELRAEGNSFFSLSQKPGLIPAEKEKALSDAISAFRAAQAYATDNDERSSADKNLSIAAFALAQHIFPKESDRIPDQYMELLRLAIMSFLSALKNSQESKENSWRQSLIGLTNVSVTSLIALADPFDLVKRVHFFLGISFHFGRRNPVSSVVASVATLNRIIADLLFKVAVTKMSKNLYLEAQGDLRDVISYLEVARGFDSRFVCLFICFFPAPRQFLSIFCSVESSELVGDAVIELGYCNIQPLLQAGIDLLSKSTEETVDMDYLWLAFDKFTQAVNEERHGSIDLEEKSQYTHKPVELEAEACSYLGKIYEILSSPKAYDYSLLSMHLALSIIGNPEAKQYYRDAKALVDKHRRLKGEEENAERELLKKVIAPKLEKLSPLENLKPKEFVKQLYLAFPLEDSLVVKPASDTDKEVITAASKSYASAKAMATNPQDKLLYEEILMPINDRVAQLKSAS